MNMYVKSMSFTISVPAGDYYLCDPCYAVPGNLWLNLLKNCHYFHRPVGYAESEGREHQVLGFSTAHGDGVYKDQFGNNFTVDAGLIGLTPVEMCDGEPQGSFVLVRFEEETECSVTDGIMKFGQHVIDTN